jgi:uncharacterized protein YutE (UPF0331/DUF86 family)
LIDKKLSFIEARVRELRELARPELIDRDVREERFVAHTLQLAVQAALDVASHIVSDDNLGEPNTNRELFDLLGKNRWLPQHLTGTMRSIVGFRNILVHGYQAVDLKIMRDVVENRLDDLLAFVDAIRERLD